MRIYEDATQALVWRQRAERLRALAKITHEERARLELVELARQWESMARVAEAMRSRMNSLWASPTLPPAARRPST